MGRDGNRQTTQNIENIVGRKKGRATYWKAQKMMKPWEVFFCRVKSCYRGRRKETYSGTELDRDIKHSTTQIERYTHRHYTQKNTGKIDDQTIRSPPFFFGLYLLDFPSFLPSDLIWHRTHSRIHTSTEQHNRRGRLRCCLC